MNRRYRGAMEMSRAANFALAAFFVLCLLAVVLVVGLSLRDL